MKTIMFKAQTLKIGAKFKTNYYMYLNPIEELECDQHMYCILNALE